MTSSSQCAWPAVCGARRYRAGILKLQGCDFNRILLQRWKFNNCLPCPYLFVPSGVWLNVACCTSFEVFPYGCLKCMWFWLLTWCMIGRLTGWSGWSLVRDSLTVVAVANLKLGLWLQSPKGWWLLLRLLMCAKLPRTNIQQQCHVTFMAWCSEPLYHNLFQLDYGCMYQHYVYVNVFGSNQLSLGFLGLRMVLMEPTVIIVF